MIKKCLKIFIVSLFLFNFSISLVSAEDETRSYSDPIIFEPQVTIPGSNFIKGEPYEMESNTTTLAKYVKAIYDYLLSIVGITAAIVLMIGGVMWLTAGGSSERVGQAKSWVSGSLTGLVLALTSYLIMQTINPQLVSFTATEVPEIKPAVYGCCSFDNSLGVPNARLISDIECYRIYTSETVKEQIPVPPTVASGSETLSQYIKKQYAGDLSSYLNAGMERFNKTKKPNYRTRKCEDMYYCHIFKEEDRCDEFGCIKVITTNILVETTPQICEDFDGGIVTKEQLEENSSLKTLLGQTCAGREGSSCNESSSTYCYCINGNAFLGKGLATEPCGNDGGICVPTGTYPGGLKDANGNGDYCESTWYGGIKRDRGGRSCGDSLSCCRPNYIHLNYKELMGL
ncbi:MAG: pilin [Patescibacteria group bacterium]|nr:pilin [Patescibacteria group bacterium]